jgi:hypothetical protein
MSALDGDGEAGAGTDTGVAPTVETVPAAEADPDLTLRPPGPIFKVSDADIFAMRILHQRGWSTTRLGKEFGISQMHAWRLVHGRQRRQRHQVVATDA